MHPGWQGALLQLLCSLVIVLATESTTGAGHRKHYSCWAGLTCCRPDQARTCLLLAWAHIWGASVQPCKVSNHSLRLQDASLAKAALTGRKRKAPQSRPRARRASAVAMSSHSDSEGDLSRLCSMPKRYHQSFRRVASAVFAQRWLRQCLSGGPQVPSTLLNWTCLLQRRGTTVEGKGWCQQENLPQHKHLPLCTCWQTVAAHLYGCRV